MPRGIASVPGVGLAPPAQQSTQVLVTAEAVLQQQEDTVFGARRIDIEEGIVAQGKGAAQLLRFAEKAAGDGSEALLGAEDKDGRAAHVDAPAAGAPGQLAI